MCDEPVTHIGVGLCDDGKDESIASRILVQAAVIKGIGRMSPIAPDRIQVALRGTGEPDTFSISSMWLVPHLVLKLSVGHMALLNDTFFVADEGTAFEDLLIDLLVLRHLGVDSRSLLESNWNSLYGTDCATVKKAA